MKKRNAFDIFNFIILGLAALSCVLPILHIAAVSFSSKEMAVAGRVIFWPVKPTTIAYSYVLKNARFWKALFITLQRSFLSIGISMTVVILAAYPLSKDNSRLKGRTAIVWFFMISILFTGGLIPLYMTVSQLGLIDNIFALVLPYSVQVFNVVLLLNFFRRVPKEIEEAAVIDGAGQWRILWQLYVPVSKTALATLVLFVTVFNWNSWFDGMIFMNHIDKYPLQTYLRTVVINNDLSSILSKSVEEAKKMMELSQRTIITAQIFIGALPVLAVYPFLQKYFVKGMTIGSVKG